MDFNSIPFNSFTISYENLLSIATKPPRRTGKGHVVLEVADRSLVRHDTLKAAVAEADRLAKENPGKEFVILSPRAWRKGAEKVTKTVSLESGGTGLPDQTNYPNGVPTGVSVLNGVL